MLRKQNIIIVITVFIMLLCCSCASDDGEKLPQLIIGCDNYRPYNYTDEDGEPAGMDVDLAREACRRMGYEPVFKQIEWNDRELILNEGIVDCLWSCFSMDGQENRYAWVGPYMYSRQVVAVLEDSDITSLSDLEGRRVAVRVGSKAEGIFLRRNYSVIPKVESVVCLNDMDEVITALNSDYVEAAAGYAAALREVLENDGIKYRFLEQDLVRAELGIAFAKDGDPELREKLRLALKDMRLDGTTASILEKYGVDTTKTLRGVADGN